MTSLDEQATAGAAHYAAGRFDDAQKAYRKALELAPGHAGILHNLGVALAATGELDEAAACFRRAQALQPASAAHSLALGHLEFGRNCIEAAEAAFAEAAKLDPRSIEAQYNLGYARVELRRGADALAPLEIARSLDPTNAQVWYELFTTRLGEGEREAAYADFLAFEQGAAVTPFLLHAALDSVRALGDAARESRYLRLALDHAYRTGDLSVLAAILARLQYFDVDRGDLFRLYEAYDRLMREHIGNAPLASRSIRVPGERIRIGYVSADFRQHVMGRLMRDVITAHDRSRYAIHLYALGHETGGADPLAMWFRESADRYVALPSFDDAHAARVIAADDCDVLVDLMGHTRHSRPEIFARKPARVIVTHLGYHGALGLRQVDYKLTDRHADVADAGLYQIERPLVMGSCVLPLRSTPSALADRELDAGKAQRLRAALAIDAGAIVFGEFVPVHKLSPRCLALWRNVLDEVPRAVLLFSPTSVAEHPAFVRQVVAHGIDCERIRFIPRGDDDAARARYTIVDLVLDTLPYSGGDTTIAALEAHVPVVALAGTRHAERMSASILRHLGLDDLVATSERAYVERAVALARDDGDRERAASRVAQRCAAAATDYPARYTRDLEAALETAIRSAPLATTS
jgi:predicted O-linked N-acetylglucosamine transferase (SPINDLY family)